MVVLCCKYRYASDKLFQSDGNIQLNAVTASEFMMLLFMIKSSSMSHTDFIVMVAVCNIFLIFVVFVKNAVKHSPWEIKPQAGCESIINTLTTRLWLISHGLKSTECAKVCQRQKTSKAFTFDFTSLPWRGSHTNQKLEALAKGFYFWNLYEKNVQSTINY